MELASGYHLWPFHILILFISLISWIQRKKNSKKDIWVSAKGLHILNKKVSFRYSQDKLKMVILSILVRTIFSPEPRRRAEALTLVLLCSVCFGGPKAAKCRLIFPSWRWLEKWVKIQKCILHTHTHTHYLVHIFIRVFTDKIPFRPILHYQSCQHCDIHITMLNKSI